MSGLELRQADEVLSHIEEKYSDLLEQGGVVVGVHTGAGSEHLALMSPGSLGYLRVEGCIRKVSMMPLENLTAWLNWHALGREWTPMEVSAVCDRIEEDMRAVEEFKAEYQERDAL